VQIQRSAIQVEVTSLRNKYETLQRNYNTVKRARKKKAKGQVQADLDTAEEEAKALTERVSDLEQDLRAAHAQLGDASREHREALREAETAKLGLERQIAALRVRYV
jgi:predicted  nucleic acid-binding Zn-ribbon protein